MSNQCKMKAPQVTFVAFLLCCSLSGIRAGRIPAARQGAREVDYVRGRNANTLSPRRRRQLHPMRKLVHLCFGVWKNQTPYQAAQSGVKRLRRVDAPLLGVVINRVGEHSHGYGYGRYSYYADGYQPHYGYYGEHAKKTSK